MEKLENDRCSLIMSCSLLMGSGSAVLGAELAESDIFLEDAEEIVEDSPFMDLGKPGNSCH